MTKKSKRRDKQRFRVLPGQGRRFSLANLKKAFVYYVLMLLALVVVVQLGYHWLSDQYLAWRLQIVEAEREVMQQEHKASGLITRKEETIRSPVSGMILRLAEPGERIAVGSELAKIGVISAREMETLQNREDEEAIYLWRQFSEYWERMFSENEEEPVMLEKGEGNGGPATEVPEDNAFEDIVTIQSEQAGLLSCYLDGWENRSEGFHLSEEDFFAKEPTGYFTVEGDLVESGQPFVKIVNNWEWFYNIILPLHPGSELTTYDNINLVFDFAPEESVTGNLVQSEIDKEKQEVRLTYVIDRQIPGFEQIRWADASLLYHRREGIIIPVDALLEKEYQTGVYLNQGGRVVFTPVVVLDKREDFALVEGLHPKSLVISRPELVEEGQRLN